MPAITTLRSKTKFVAVIILIAAILTSTQRITNAGCSDIDDLDDRAKCYEEKKAKAEDEYESISKKLEDIRSKKDGISQSIATYLSELSVTQEQIDELQAQIDSIQSDLAVINENLTDRKGKLAEKTSFRNNILRTYAKRSYRTPLELLFSQTSFNGFQYDAFSYKLNKTLSSNALETIHLLSSEIDSFEGDKKEAVDIKGELEDTQKELLALKSDIDAKKAQADSEFNNLHNTETDYKDELFDLEKRIDELSAKQQAVLNQKAGTETGSVGDYAPTSVKTPDAPFSPAFAAFSYGAYTHYKGMSQYGAQGRAKKGDDYKDILKFYYDEGITDIDKDRICVEGIGEMDLQKYLYGLAEMPSTWEKDALRAQAIAGRSYAYRYIKSGKCICTSQSCQVFLKSKSDNPPDRWKDAVDDTKGEILKGDVVAYYSSTSGGYQEGSGWDTKCGNSSCWPDEAYEDIAGSPWFRKAWYTKSYNSSDNCGRAHPWLTEEEMADIVNAWRVWVKGSSSERDRISPVTTSCWGGNPYSLDSMRDKADDYGTAYKKVTKISVDIGNNGRTSKVKLETDKGTVEIDGETFKTVFNLRAPSYLSIKSRLYDFEKD